MRTAIQEIPNLKVVLKDTGWVLIGGLATRAYMPERMTHDVGILIHERDAAVVRQRLLAAGYQLVGALSVGGFSLQRANEPPLDVLTRSDAWVDTALESPTYDAAGLPVLPLAYLIVLKLEAGRMQDLTDISRMLAATNPAERAAIRAVVAQECPLYRDDFEQLILLADLGME